VPVAAANAPFAQRPAPIVVLITDGQPNCEFSTDPDAGAGDPAFTIQQIDSLAKQGIRTAIIALGPDPLSDNTVEQMAKAGALPCSGSLCQGRSFYEAQMVNDLTAIIPALVKQLEQTQAGICDG
jgi:hypothetical protein